MSKKIKLNPVASALGISLTAAMATFPAQADQNPFGMTDIGTGYTISDKHEGKCGEGKCGEGKCGHKDGEGKCGEGKCGEKSS